MVSHLEQQFHPTAQTPQEQIAADLRTVRAFEDADVSMQASHHTQERLDVIEMTSETQSTQSNFAPQLQNFVAPFLHPEIEQDAPFGRNDSSVHGHNQEIHAPQINDTGRIDEHLVQQQQMQAFAERPVQEPQQVLDPEAMNSVIGMVAGNVSMDPITVSGIADEFTAADNCAHLGDKVAENFGDFDNNLIQNFDSYDPEAILAQAREYEESLRERHEKNLEDEKERKEQDDKYREEEAKRYAAAMLAALKARQAQEEANRIKAQKDPLSIEARQNYVVMPGDTLELIAQKRLFNKRLAALIYEINKSRIPIRMREGKRLLQLRPRLLLLLPTQMEIKKFQTRLFGTSDEKFEYDYDFDKRSNNPGLIVSGSQIASGANWPTHPRSPEEEAAAQKRREHVESTLGKIPDLAEEDEGRIKYVVRLGDSLRSISIRHPALKDVTLWKLVAELNNLSRKTDASGNPAADLERGVVLLLPLPHEIAEFRERQRQKDQKQEQRPREPQQVSEVEPAHGPKNYSHEPEEQELPNVDTSEDIQYITHSRIFVGARDYLAGKNSRPTGNPQSDFRPDEAISHTPGEKPVERPDSGVSSAPPGYIPREQQQRNQIDALSEDCRIISYSSPEGGFRARLEYKQNEFWLPVVLYEVDDGDCLRHEFNLNGSRQSKKIELPSAQSRQLARNDLKKNWTQYVKRFLESGVQ